MLCTLFSYCRVAEWHQQVAIYCQSRVQSWASAQFVHVHHLFYVCYSHSSNLRNQLSKSLFHYCRAKPCRSNTHLALLKSSDWLVSMYPLARKCECWTRAKLTHINGTIFHFPTCLKQRVVFLMISRGMETELKWLIIFNLVKQV